MTTLTYRQARLIVLGFGTALIAGVALSAYYRGADLVEVGAMLLFLPILVGMVFWRIRGGVIVAIAVSALYLVVRFSTLGDLPAIEFAGNAVVRTLLFLGLGFFGGWANDLLEHALLKLELYDEVDDATGVGNARAFLSVADREVSRAGRYDSVFSLAVLKVERSVFDTVKEKAAVRALRAICQTIEASVRATDLVARIPLDDREDIVVILPETGREGAEVFIARLVTEARGLAAGQGLTATNGAISGLVVTVPGDEELMKAFTAEVRASLPVAHDAWLHEHERSHDI